MQKQASLDSFFFTQIASYHTLPSDSILISIKLQPNCNHDFEGKLQPAKQKNPVQLQPTVKTAFYGSFPTPWELPLLLKFRD
ncbi:hypothetical protein [Victivallis vadensis]|uniref:hypothetical protein n=1 Tax=Victivallis vadensis TaxID=172901 RepID=UPI00105837E5|nr:hypothetical protein [Victivallis vadensis]